MTDCYGHYPRYLTFCNPECCGEYQGCIRETQLNYKKMIQDRVAKRGIQLTEKVKLP